MDIKAVKTTPFQDQILGTSGLRKKVSVVRQTHYIENFVQSIFDSLDGFEGKTLVIGGDGRFYNSQAIQMIIKIAVANQFGRLVIGQNGILSTPAASHLIVKKQAFGGIILSASHNPGGSDGDFGIKYDIETGAPAPQTLADAISARTKNIDRYWTIDLPEIDLSRIGEQTVGSTVIEVIDSVSDYALYMQEIFDFNLIRSLFRQGFTMTFDSMNAVTGPYAKYIFETLLGAAEGSVIRATPLPDFGGVHPEPNLTYNKSLVDFMKSDQATDFAAASDGDGDRYMILGPSFFVNPSDSLAILAGYMDQIPFYASSMSGVARSMPTSAAVDMVARQKGFPVFETPTGWKFFGSLLGARKIALCGEESFGAGSSHLYEKDGIWAVLFWLTILAKTGLSVQRVNEELWHAYGRIYTSTHSYEDLDSAKAKLLMEQLRSSLPTLPQKEYNGFKIKEAFDFSYTDPITGDVADKQGICLVFEDHSRIVMRLSGTGSSGATLRVYYNRFMGDPKDFSRDVQEVIEPLVTISKDVSDLKALTGREYPTVIT